MNSHISIKVYNKSYHRTIQLVFISIFLLLPSIGNINNSTSSQLDIIDQKNKLNENIYETRPICHSFNNSMYDSIEIFNPGQSEFRLNLSFQKNYVYYFEFQTFIPYSKWISLNLYLTSPKGRNYHCIDYNTELNNSQEKIFFEFGSAESGIFSYILIIDTDLTLNLHIFIEKFRNLEPYYREYAFGITEFMPMLISEIEQFGLNQLEKSFSCKVEDDKCYMVNIFLMSPICSSDITEDLKRICPTIKMEFSIESYQYMIYPEIPITTYALFNNLEHDNIFDYISETGPVLENSSFLIRYGSALSGNLTISLQFTKFFPFDLNYGFVFYETGSIGDGPDENTNMSTENNTTSEQNQNNQSSLLNDTTHSHNRFNLDQTIQLYYTSLNNLIQNHFWIFTTSTFSILIGIWVFMKYKSILKPKMRNDKLKHESDENVK